VEGGGGQVWKMGENTIPYPPQLLYTSSQKRILDLSVKSGDQGARMVSCGIIGHQTHD